MKYKFQWKVVQNDLEFGSKTKILICISEYSIDYSVRMRNGIGNVVEQLKKMEVECAVCSLTRILNFEVLKRLGNQKKHKASVVSKVKIDWW